MRLQRLRTHRGKEHGIQPKRRAGSARNSQMAQMRRVKAAAEEGDAAAAVAVAGSWVRSVPMRLMRSVASGSARIKSATMRYLILFWPSPA